MPNLNDAIASDLVDRQVKALRLAEGLSQRLIKELSAAEDEVMAKLRSSDLTRFTRQRTITLLNQIRRIMAAFSGASLKTMRVEVSAIAQKIAELTAGDMNDVFGVDLINPTLTATSLKRLLDDQAIIGGQTLQDFWDRQPDLIVDAYSQVIRTGLIVNASKGDMIRDVIESTGLAAKRGAIRTAVRTSIMTVANLARTDMYADNQDLVKGIQWLSTLDVRTTPICRGLDGCCWSLPDYEPINGTNHRYPGPVAHPNCRSTQIPLLRSFEEIAGANKKLARKLDEAMSNGVRASMDGEVASDLSYEDWLKSRSETSQREVLGSARFDLWRAGKLTLAEMIDQSNRPLTLDELDDG